jgi:hypothetical protein
MVIDRMDKRIVTLDGGCISGDTLKVEPPKLQLDLTQVVMGESLKTEQAEADESQFADPVHEAGREPPGDA